MAEQPRLSQRATHVAEACIYSTHAGQRALLSARLTPPGLRSRSMSRRYRSSWQILAPQSVAKGAC